MKTFKTKNSIITKSGIKNKQKSKLKIEKKEIKYAESLGIKAKRFQ